VSQDRGRSRARARSAKQRRSNPPSSGRRGDRPRNQVQAPIPIASAEQESAGVGEIAHTNLSPPPSGGDAPRPPPRSRLERGAPGRQRGAEEPPPADPDGDRLPAATALPGASGGGDETARVHERERRGARPLRRPWPHAAHVARGRRRERPARVRKRRPAAHHSCWPIAGRSRDAGPERPVGGGEPAPPRTPGAARAAPSPDETEFSASAERDGWRRHMASVSARRARRAPSPPSPSHPRD